MKNKKLKLIGIRNGKDNHTITFEKNRDALQGLKDFIAGLNLDGPETDEFFYYHAYPKKKRKISKNLVEVAPKIEYFTDMHIHLENSKYELEIFFADTRIFVTIRRKLRTSMKELSRVLEKIPWITKKEINKLKKEREEALQKYLPKKLR